VERYFSIAIQPRARMTETPRSVFSLKVHRSTGDSPYPFSTRSTGCPELHSGKVAAGDLYLPDAPGFRGPVVGDSVYHCHILGHDDSGMMAIIRVIPAKEPRQEYQVVID
jgi:hypothetical protein